MDPSEWFPFSPDRLRGDTVYDAEGRPIGTLEATRYGEGGEVESVVIHLTNEVRRERLVHGAKLDVGVGAIRVRRDGRAALTMDLEDLLEDRQVAHAHEGHGSGAPDHTPHGGGAGP